jgi:prepilin-type N-terminal cleavage/methylation domain-containing protein
MIIKKQIIKFGFTLIELMITITIIVVLTMMTYAPYNYYQNKAKLKITLRQVSQLLYESRNMAVN